MSCSDACAFYEAKFSAFVHAQLKNSLFMTIAIGTGYNQIPFVHT